MTTSTPTFLVRRCCGLIALFVAIGLTIPAPDALAQPADEAYQAGRFDNGKMWTFDYPPVDYLKETYAFEPDAAWFETARLGALRIPGCTASFVSPNGLVMTNHHCGRSHVTSVERPGEHLTDEGFYAATLDEERPAPNMWADQLIAIDDVTDEVYAALEGMETEAERANARQEAIERIQTRMGEAVGGAEAGMQVQVISLYNGGRYSAYTFRRYTDIRLVMTPELQLGYYGGDTDNFTYPRYALDVTFFRVYDEDGNPLQTDNYFTWTSDGVEEGDLIFVVGNPGSTFRLETVAQLEYRRDVQEPATLHLFDSRADALQAAYDANPDHPQMSNVRNTIFSLLNAEKLYEGRVRALNEPMVMARRADTERQLKAAIAANADLQAEYGDLFDKMATVQEEKHELAPAFGAFLGITSPALASATVRRAMLAYRYLNERQNGATEQALAPLQDQLLAVQDQPPGVDVRLMALRLEDFRNYLGAQLVVGESLQDKQPMEVATYITDNSALSSAASTQEALENGTLSMDDPAVQVVADYVPQFLDFQSATIGLNAREEDLASALGRARFEVYGTEIPPDATFSLRLADGVVQGYPYNGTVAPPYTTFYGLYDHYYSYGPDSEWDLPERWLDPPSSFDYATPLNFVSTADITGGNSGSPIINADLEVVGIAFDGNIESLSGDYIYLPATNRCVGVDARGILEALDEIYDADRLVLELAGGQFVPTEEEADEVMSSR